jgi:hypothetical protein
MKGSLFAWFRSKDEGGGADPTLFSDIFAVVIPGRREAASPESITTGCGYGFRACALRRIPE